MFIVSYTVKQGIITFLKLFTRLIFSDISYFTVDVLMVISITSLFILFSYVLSF